MSGGSCRLKADEGETAVKGVATTDREKERRGKRVEKREGGGNGKLSCTGCTYPSSTLCNPMPRLSSLGLKTPTTVWGTQLDSHELRIFLLLK